LFQSRVPGNRADTVCQNWRANADLILLCWPDREESGLRLRLSDTIDRSHPDKFKFGVSDDNARCRAYAAACCKSGCWCHAFFRYVTAISATLSSKLMFFIVCAIFRLLDGVYMASGSCWPVASLPAGGCRTQACGLNNLPAGTDQITADDGFHGNGLRRLTMMAAASCAAIADQG